MKTPFWEANNCYAVLGTKPSATPQEIKSAYREAALRNHPDHGGSHDAQVRVNLAYETLSNPVDRVAHDLRWPAEAKGVKVGSGGPSPRTPEPRPGHTPSPAPPPRASQTPPTPSHPARPLERTRRADPLSALKRRVQDKVEAKAEAAWADLESRAAHLATEFRQQMRTARTAVSYRFVAAAVLCMGAIKLPILWLGVVGAGVSLLGKLSGPRINGQNRSPLKVGGAWVAEAASAEAKGECTQRVGVLQRYHSELASIAELVLRPSTFDDSESQVARRITTAFFVLGYLPLEYSASDRTLLLGAGDEQILVRFRHRSGAAVNVTYVEKLIAAMRRTRIKRGYLFCSPGLSGNAALLAEENDVRSYTMETMSQWIADALTGNYDGPEGDILENIDSLKSFLGRLSNALPSHTGAARTRRRWRRW